MLIDSGGADAKACFICAHGAGAGMDSDFLQLFARALSHYQIHVVRFDFPYMQKAKALGKRRPPAAVTKLMESYQQVIAQVTAQFPHLPVFIGGKSMGGRVASMVLPETNAKGAICLGYPFHPLGKPDQLRIAHLQALTKPLLIVQGERDTFGHRQQVERYPLSDNIAIAFLFDGDHSFKPRKASGFDQQQHIHSAARLTAEFIKGQL